MKDITDIVKESIASGNLSRALSTLTHFIQNIDFVYDDFENMIILLSARYNANQKNFDQGLVTLSDFRIESNRITSSLTQLNNRVGASIPYENRLVNVNMKSPREGSLKEGKSAHASQDIIRQSLHQKNKVKILFLAANSDKQRVLRTDFELREIEEILNKSTYRDQFELIKSVAVRISDLQDGLLKHSPDIVHFSGHGNRDGIILVNETKEGQYVKVDALANLFGFFGKQIRCIFLNSCYSEQLGRQIKQKVPHVIGMKKAVPDRTAIEFAKAFYRSIGAGRGIEFSFEFAKNSIDLHLLNGKDYPVYL